MRNLRTFMLLLLVLFTADVVQAAPAALVMQLDSIAHPAEMPCHQHDIGSTQQDDQHDSQQDTATHGQQCHSCFACVTLLTAPAYELPVPALCHVLAPHFFSNYQPCSSAPALRPPILA